MHTARDPELVFTDRHVSAAALRVLFETISLRLGPASVATILATAGEHENADALAMPSVWISYDRFRRFLQVAGKALGGIDQLRELDITAMAPDAVTESADRVLHTLGSPEKIYASLQRANGLITSVVRVESTKVGPGEWWCTRSLDPGFEPFPELCAFLDGVNAIPPTLFGMPRAQVEEVACQCAGAPACEVRIRWAQGDWQSTRLARLERSHQWLERRLEALQRTVSNLVSAADLHEALSMIVSSAADAVSAVSYLLVLDNPPPGERAEFALGLDPVDAARIASAIRNGQHLRDPQFLVVSVDMAQERFGYLVAVNPAGAGFVDAEREMLAFYAGLAGTAIAALTALAVARTQAATAHTLLTLGSSLAELASTEEVAKRVSRAATVLTDGRGAIMAITDPTGTAGFFGCYQVGDDRTACQEMDKHRFSYDPVEAKDGRLRWHDASDPRFGWLVGTKGIKHVVSVPVVAKGELLGWIVVGTDSVVRRSEQQALAERLHGLAGQAATSLANARLHHQVRHQALHDSLTGLPNRAFVFERANQLLSAANRHNRRVTALFVDLDDFKEVNDTLGHNTGDQLLRAVAERLQGTVRAGETVGRLGGDEFVVLTEGPSPLLAARVLEALDHPFTLPGGITRHITASVGMATMAGGSTDSLLGSADVALYQAKARGKHQAVTFDPAALSPLATQPGHPTA